MTNEEIEKLVAHYADEYDIGDWGRHGLEQAIRAAVSQAYEEALQLGMALERAVDASEDGLLPGETLGRVPSLVAIHAKQLRALKESLAQEPVSP